MNLISLSPESRLNYVTTRIARGLPLILSFSRKGRRDPRIILRAWDRAPSPLPLRERGRGEGAFLAVKNFQEVAA